MIKRFLPLLFLTGTICTAQAQLESDKSQLSGSLESNSIYYLKDSKLEKAVRPDDHFGSHNFLKLDYHLGQLSAGIQAEAYLPALQGFDLEKFGPYRKFFLASKYIQWQDKKFLVQIGNIYEQFGSGLIFRSYEDRALGFNNSLEGVQGMYNFGDKLKINGVFGRPRLYTEYTGSWVRGVDLHLSPSEIFGWQKFRIALEGSYVNRYEPLDKDNDTDFSELGLTSPNLNLYSGRINLDYKGLSLRGEYVTKGDKDLTNSFAGKAVEGNVWLGEAGYTHNRLGILATFRRLEHMGTMLSLYGQGTGNVLNYIPGLTRQYTYMLTNLNPYQVNTEGEIGGQFDIYYSIRSRKHRFRQWNLHVNASTFYTLEENGGGKKQLLWRDLNFDIERQWHKNLKTTLLFSRQEWDPNHGGSEGKKYTSDIFVADMTCKFDHKKSLHAELQYLRSDDFEGDWMAASAEFSMAPRWSIFTSDMYNTDKTKIHYYSGGFSYTQSRTRLQISYGRNREGFVCSGGVCRFSPAYTGLNLVLTTSF